MQNDRESLAYTKLWLSLLFDVCKEFVREVEEQIMMRPVHFSTQGNLGKRQEEVRQHFNQRKTMLNAVRNATFHFKNEPHVLLDFLGDSQAIGWAEELHVKLEDFFSAYRVETAVGYATNGRDMEAGL